MRKLILLALLGTLAACQEPTPANTKASQSGLPTQVGEAFGCQIYRVRLNYFVAGDTVGSSQIIFITRCPEIQNISWEEKQGKSHVTRSWSASVPN